MTRGGGPSDVSVDVGMRIGANHYAAECEGEWKSSDASGKFKGPTEAK